MEVTKELMLAYVLYVREWTILGREIYWDIIQAKLRAGDYLGRLIICFKPQIGKYSRILKGEDTRQELIIYLIKVIDTIPVNKNIIWHDKSILSYISKSIKNEYIKISKRENSINNKKVELDLCNELESEYFEEDFSFVELFKELTEKESHIIKLVYIYGFSVTEIAQTMEITRQAVNKSKNRALKKLKKIYQEVI
ncbi:sigma-70 family RNA polymerase sigma factor [Clostridium gasigenes]|uniref:sigma-70 family RNA polymerase sigma factor n=1 Tax=Clostridium gasigenes TaxID=94869 RepID=UPI001C0BDB84|nr:sigma-70 family RNA polymerase sigma factor [Clostridium gasigenes]MBU3109835.1 sigma-70 family RNA polymerase sigma factor [Clostridium gasigenes]